MRDISMSCLLLRVLVEHGAHFGKDFFFFVLKGHLCGPLYRVLPVLVLTVSQNLRMYCFSNGL